METVLIAVVLLAWFIWMFLDQRLIEIREKKRLRAGTNRGTFGQMQHRFEQFLERIGAKAKPDAIVNLKQTKKLEEMSKKLQRAGLESGAEVGKYHLLKLVCYTVLPVLGALGFLKLGTYFATILFLIVSIVSLFLPELWLRAKRNHRNEEIERELPLLIDLLNLGTSAGWDTGASLEKVIDALAVEYPSHPLIKEFRKARWLATSGYSWFEALERVGDRLESDAVRRATLAISQAIKQGGDRTSQMQGIAEDAQRVYYSELDKRLAALPMHAVVVTVLTLAGYMLIIMAPAVVQLQQSGIGSIGKSASVNAGKK